MIATSADDDSSFVCKVYEKHGSDYELRDKIETKQINDDLDLDFK